MSQTLYTFNGGGTSGDWDAAYSWTTDPTGSTSINSRIPTSNDNVVITNSFVLLVKNPVAATGLNVTVQKGGVLDLTTATNNLPNLTSLSGQGTLRIAGAYFPTITTNNFDDANTGTVEFYNWPAGTATLPQPASNQYNNLRLLNTGATAGTAFTAQLGSSLTLTGNLILTRTSAAAFPDSKVGNPYATPAAAAAGAGISLTLGKTAGTNVTLTALGDLNIGAGTFLGVTAVNASHAINVSGSFINNGTVNLHNGTANDNQLAALKFTGTTDASFACNGDTDLDIMTVDKGIDSQVLLNVTSTVNVHGTSFGNLRLFHFAGGSGFGIRLLALINGNTKLGNNIYLPKIHNVLSEYSLGSTTTSPTLWIAGATVLNDNAALIAVYGTFRMTGGSFSGITDAGMVVREDGQVIMEGGTVTVNKFRPSRTTPNHRGSFIMSGGVFDCTGVSTTSVDDKYARFSVPYLTQSFRMTGGTIRVQRPNAANSGADGLFHIGVNPNNATITGGTIELVLPNSNLNGKILTTTPLWNLTVKKPVAGGTSKALLADVNVDPLYQTYSNPTAQPLTVLNALTLDATNPTTFDAAGLNLTIQGTFTIGTGCTYLPGSNTTTFNGTQDKQFLANNGTIGATAGEGTFNNWTVDKAAGTLILSGSVTTYNVPAAAQLSLLNGVLDDGGKTIKAFGDVVNSAFHTSGGGSGSIVLSGAALQTLSGDGTGVFGNLKLNSTMTAGAVAAQITANMSISNQLTLQSNNIMAIGAYRLSLTNISTNAITSPGNTFSDTRFIQTAGNQSDLGLQRTYGGTNTFTFPVGTGAKYTPAIIALTSATALGKYGQVSVSPANSRNPFLSGSNNALNYYWKVRSVGFGTIPAGAISATFTMKTADAGNTTAGSTAGYIPGFYTANTVSWTKFNDTNLVSASPPTADISFNNVLSAFDGEFTTGVLAAFGPVTAYYSRATGNWETPATWSTDQTLKYTGAAATVKPGPGNPVFIGSAASSLNHYVTVTANAATAGSLVIETGSTLDVKETTGHNFGALPDAKVNGAGLLRVSSSGAVPIFPGGDFGSFLLPGGGTVEYYTNTTQNITLPTASGSLSLVSYRNLWLSPANGRTITMPDVNLRVYENMKTGTSTGTTGIVSLNGTSTRTLQVDSLLNVQYGTLRFANGTAQALVFNKNVQVDANATFDMSGAGATVTTNTVTVAGSLTNNGKLDFNATSKAGLTFTGTRNTKLTGTNAAAPAATNLYTLTVNKGTSRVPTLTVDVANALTTPTNSWLTLTNGTLSFEKANGTLNIHDADTPFVLTDNAGLTVNNATATVNVATGNGSVTDNTTPTNNTSATSDLKLAGELRALQGTLNVGTTTGLGNDIEYAAAGAPTIRVTGGTLNVNGQIRRNVTNLDGSLRYEQTGGTVDIAGLRASVYQSNERGLFEVQGPGSIFRMSGGDLKLRRSNSKPSITTADLYLAPDSTVVTGGTVRLGNTAAGVGNVKISVNSAVSIYDLVVESGADASNPNTGFLTGTNPLSLKGSLTIGNVNSFFNANGIGLNIDQNLNNNNTLAVTTLNTGGFQPFTTTQTTTFTGKGPALQQLVSAANNLTVFGSLVVNNAQTNGTLQLGGNAQVAGTLTLTKGTLADNGKTITVLGDVLNSAIHTSTGTGSLTLSGTANQNVGGSGLGKFGNLTLNNTAGATTTANQEITNVLTLTNGVIFIGSNLLWLSNPASSAIAGSFDNSHCIRTNGIVADLGVRKSFPSGASTAFTFPVGAAVVTKYTPVQMTVTSSTSAGTITVQPIDLAHPSTTDPAATELSYYWKVGSTGLATPTVTQVFTYYDNSAGNDVNGNESLYKLGRFLNGAWQPVGGITTSTVSTTANTLTNLAATYIDGDYTGGQTLEFGTVPTFYSRNSTAGMASGASWTDPLAWTINSDGSNPTVVPTATPTLANPVVILPGHLIISRSAGRGAATLKLDGTLDLGVNLANNFSTVSGTGTLRIGSAIFPAGNYTNFVAANTGTVEFTQAVQLPARDTYNNLTLSGVDAVNTTGLTNLDLTINGAWTIAANTKVDNLTSQNITLTSATSGATINGTLNQNDGKLTTGAAITTGSSSALTLGASPVVIGTSLTNGGTINQGNGLVTVSTSLTNAGTYNAKAGTGNIAVGTTFSNSGTYTAGTGDLNVTSTLTNTSTGRFRAGSGQVNAGTSFSNAGTYTATTNNLVHVNGDYSNLATGSFDAANSNVILRGNFTNAGTFTPGTSLVQFITDVNRLLTGNTTFYDLQKLGTSSLSFGPSTDVHVADLMTIQNSVVFTGSGSSNILYLDNAAIQPIVGQTLTSYVSGRLAIALPNDVGGIRVFPVGSGQRYRPVTIKQTGTGSAAPVVLVEIINGKPAGNVNASLSNLSANRYYRIQLLSGIIDQPTVQLSFNTDVEDEKVNVPGNLRVAYAAGPISSSTSWASAGGSGVFSPDSPKGYTTSGQFSTTIDGTSFFALGSTNFVDNPLTGAAPLPVELVQFSAVRQGTNVQVAWATASEKNSDYFAVERSANGQYFNEIGRVDAHGSSTSRHEYGTLDTAPMAGLSYYRLRQVDRDGKFAYSPVATVRFDDKAAAPTLLAYPNPATGTGFQLAALNLAGTGGTVRLLDGVGRVIFTQTVATGSTETTIQPTKALASGMYIATWTTPEGLKLTTKVAVE